MSDFPDIGYGTVTGRFLAGVLDSDDPADAPDGEPLRGEVVFTPTASVILVNGAAPPTTLFPQPVRVHLDNDGALSVSLWATDDPDGNPIAWQWHVHFELTHHGQGVHRSPFNFELPTGSQVDLTIVSPLLTPSPGTIIIRGEDGEDGMFDASIITGQGDLLVGTGPAAFAVLPVGAPTDALIPDPAEPTGLRWGPAAASGGGLSEYVDERALRAVRLGEVGVWHVANVSLEFASFIPTYPGIFEGTGPAEIVVVTTVTDHPLNSGPYANRSMADQYMEFQGLWMRRQYIFDRGSGAIISGPYAWGVEPKPLQPNWNGQIMLSPETGAYGAWQLATWSADAVGDSIVRRDGTGRIKAWAPDHNGQAPDPLHVVNKDYLDRQLAALRTELGLP